jgi:hypothetical protein
MERSSWQVHFRNRKKPGGHWHGSIQSRMMTVPELSRAFSFFMVGSAFLEKEVFGFEDFIAISRSKTPRTDHAGNARLRDRSGGKF